MLFFFIQPDRKVGNFVRTFRLVCDRHKSHTIVVGQNVVSCVTGKSHTTIVGQNVGLCCDRQATTPVEVGGRPTIDRASENGEIANSACRAVIQRVRKPDNQFIDLVCASVTVQNEDPGWIEPARGFSRRRKKKDSMDFLGQISARGPPNNVARAH